MYDALWVRRKAIEMDEIGIDIKKDGGFFGEFVVEAVQQAESGVVCWRGTRVKKIIGRYEGN